MSLTDFWDGPAELVKYYREKFKLDQQRENETAWLNGMYIYEALLDASPAFGFNKGKIKPYPEKPHPIGDQAKEEDKEKKLENGRAAFQAMAEAWNKKFLADKNNNLTTDNNLTADNNLTTEASEDGSGT